MRLRLPLVLLLFLALCAAGAIHAQSGNPITSNPIPAPITKRGLTVEIRDVVRLPETRGLRPADQDVVPAGWARVSFVRDLPDGRRFANDSRGLLYLLDCNNQPSVYANVGATFPLSVYNRLESGFIGFTFHPDFARNGLFYTVHAERGPGNPKTPDFIPPGYTPADVTYHNIITEWHATNPAANTFAGTRRELLREAHVVDNLTHPMGAVEFNPDGEAGRPGLWSALHQRQRSWIQQRRGTEREQSHPDAAARLDHDRHPADRSAQSVGNAAESRAWATTRFQRRTSSPRMAIRRHWARSMPMASGTPTGSPGISPTGRCSPPTSA